MLTTLYRRLLGAYGTAASVIAKSSSCTTTTTPLLAGTTTVAAYNVSSMLSLPESKPPVTDPAIEKLIRANRQWVSTKNADDPEYFQALGQGQKPDFLYIGCSDSRVSISSLTGLDLGHVFVHRNIANMVGKW